jgi:PTH1 family peptidyl-tRNA hydrolase
MNRQVPKLIIGLGNPGLDYEGTRHNIGFAVIDALLRVMPKMPEDAEHTCDSLVWSGQYRGRKIALQKPMTYMNDSGLAVGKYCRTHQIAVSDILVVFDDVALPLGRIRFRLQGSSGGQNGVQSIIDAFDGSEKFPRLRIGVGAAEEMEDRKSFVLSSFSSDEQPLVDKVVAQSVEAVQRSLRSGITDAMNTYNGLNVTNDEQEETED